MDAPTSHEYLSAGRTVLISLRGNVGLSHCEDLEALCRGVAEEIARGATRHAIVDCGQADLLGCTALGLLLRLWKAVARGGGQFALCGLSPTARETIGLFQLDRLWSVYPSRRHALRALTGETAAAARVSGSSA